MVCPGLSANCKKKQEKHEKSLICKHKFGNSRKNFVPHGSSIVPSFSLSDLSYILCLTDENENEKPPVEDVVKRDYSENRNMYRDDEQVSLCVERYEERSL